MPKFLTIVCLLAFSPVFAQQPPHRLAPDKVAVVDKVVQEAFDNGKLVGLAVGIIENGQVAYLKGYGLADRDSNVPVDTKTMFRWASVSKPVTAVAAMQLVEKGQLDLEADVCTLVPEFPKKDSTITTRQLLCHQAGIVHYSNGKVVKTKRQYLMANPFVDVILALDNFKESPLVNKPGEKYSYSTHGYILASAVVERAGKKSFALQVQDRIAKPLGMKSFRPDYQWEQIPYRAVGYVKKGDEIKTSTDTDVSWKLGGGGFISNIEDFARFANGLINRKLVSEETETKMWTPQKLADGTPTNYGLGFNVQAKDGKLRVSHGGAQEKTRTMMIIMPKEKRGVVLMTNSEWAKPAEITDELLKEVWRK